MTQNPIDLDLDLSGLPQNDWLGRLDELGDAHGYFEQLGSRHFALLIDAGPQLLVTFETLESARQNPGARPRGFEFVTQHGWSHLALVSDGDSWFRDPAVYRFFDRLTDDGFFDRFAAVLFFGIGSGGYAAAAYSVANPGAQVLAIRPQATLDPAQTGWDKRFMAKRRLDFNSRYGYAPDMLDAAGSAFVLCDPGFTPDALHASLFRRPNVTALRCPLLGQRPETGLDAMQITAPLIEQAMEGGLSLASFGALWRTRRSNPNYMRGLLKKAELAGRAGFVRRLCTQGLATRDSAFYRRKLQELDAAAAPQQTASAAE